MFSLSSDLSKHKKTGYQNLIPAIGKSNPANCMRNIIFKLPTVVIAE